MTRQSSRPIWIPLFGLGLLALGGVAYFNPAQSKQIAMETATRVSTKAIELWEGAGWREIHRASADTTRGYRAPQRFAKPSSEAQEIRSQRDQGIMPASHDDSKSDASKIEIAQDQDPAQRPQATAPLLAAPGNSPKLRQLGGGTAPKLQSTQPAPEKVAEKSEENGNKPVVASPSPAPTAKGGLNSPEVKKIHNPHAMKISDEGQATSQNEQALLEDEKLGPLKSAPSPVVTAEEESPVGSGVALENLAKKHAESPHNDQENKIERSVLKKPSGNEVGPALSPIPAEASPQDNATMAKRRPFTATLLDALPSTVKDVKPQPLGSETATARPMQAAPAPVTLKPEDLLDHHASNFHGVTPGESDEKAAIAALGASTTVVTDGEQRILRFNSSAFKLVEVSVVAGTVDSLTLVLNKPLPTKDIVKELGLTPFEPALVTSADGYVLGQVYPERGVVLEFAPAENGSAEVDQIVLDRVKAEPFLLRALDDKNQRYTSTFRDLEIALKLDPQEARALWLKANLLCELGKPIAALRVIDDAIRLDSISPGNYLTRAKILLAMGRHGEASRIVASVLAQRELPSQVKARALYQQAELLACGPNPDFDRGMEGFRSAIQEASALADDTRPAIRRVSRRILIESHLGVARCIAWGQLDDAEKAAMQWHERAKLLAETGIGDEDVGDDIWLAVHRSAMLTHLGLMAKSNPDREISELQIDYKRLARAATDSLYRDRVKWELAVALTDASRIESARSKHRSAGQLADLAWTGMSEGVRGREANEQDDFARGMLLYQLGSIAAVAKEDHAKAVGWYEQAIPLLERPLPDALTSQNGIRGLSLVGMGASYWEAGDKQQAITLADLGARTLQEASKTGHASRESLSLAWGNLESMYRDIGDTPAADRVAKLAAGQENAPILR